MCQTCSIVLLVVLLVPQANAESGIASYYGYGTHGRPGELTCAHRTRPFGSIIKVSYGGRSIQCRVTDRGPFIRGRVIDLSISAARALGMMRAGVVRVSLETPVTLYRVIAGPDSRWRRGADASP